MVLRDISVSYGSCSKCGSCSYMNGYYPSDIYSILSLKLLVSKICTNCGHNIPIKYMKVKASIEDLK